MNGHSPNSPSEPASAQSVDPFGVRGGQGSLKRQSLRGSLATFLAQAIKMVIQIGSQVVLARLLFPAEYGLVAMAYPVVSFLQVFNDIGLGQAIVQRPVLEQKQVSALFWLNLGVSCLLGLAVILISPLAAWAYGEHRLILLLVVLSITLPIAGINLVPTALLTRQMRFVLTARNEIIAALCGAVVTVVCALKGLSYWSLVAGQLVLLVIGNILGWLAVGWRPSSPRQLPAIWNDVKFGANITISNLATFVTTSADNVIVGLATGKVALGLYDRSYNLVVRPINQLTSPINRIAIPLLSRLVDEPEKYRSAYLQMTRVATLLLLPAMLVGISNATTLVRVLLGPRWPEAAPIFSWLCVGGLASGVYASGFWLLISQDRTRELRHLTLVAAVINVASFLIGIAWGVIGVAIGASLSFALLTTPLLLFGATRSGPVRPRDFLSFAAPFAFAGIVTYAVLVFGLRQVALPGVMRLVAATLVSYTLVTALCLVSAENRRLFGRTTQLVRDLR
jgi:PST family polysaccharide transporter